MATDGTGRKWGVSHLRQHPIHLTFGLVVLLALVVLVCLRLIRGSFDFEAGAGTPGAGR